MAQPETVVPEFRKPSVYAQEGYAGLRTDPAKLLSEDGKAL
jgi:hypothetical protein